jgi:hypothetical protein
MSVGAGRHTHRHVPSLVKDVRDAFSQIKGDPKAFEDGSAHNELRGRLLALLGVTFSLDVLGTVLMTIVGNHSFRRSAVWTTSSVLTSGAALETSGQRHYWLGLVLQLWAVTAIGALAGSFGAFFHRLYLERVLEKRASVTDPANP